MASLLATYGSELGKEEVSRFACPPVLGAWACPHRVQDLVLETAVPLGEAIKTLYEHVFTGRNNVVVQWDGLE